MFVPIVTVVLPADCDHHVVKHVGQREEPRWQQDKHDQENPKVHLPTPFVHLKLTKNESGSHFHPFTFFYILLYTQWLEKSIVKSTLTKYGYFYVFICRENVKKIIPLSTPPHHPLQSSRLQNRPK